MAPIRAQLLIVLAAVNMACGQILSTVQHSTTSTSSSTTSSSSHASSTTSSTLSISSTSSSSSSSISHIRPTSGPSPPITGYNMALTTIFTPPSDCAVRSQVTALATASGWLWHNVIDPVPGVLATSCYPSQFWSSAIATTALPPFRQLVCPQNWTTIDYNTTYAICCPYGFGICNLNSSNVQRPAQNAICTSIMWSNVSMAIDSYGPTAFLTEINTNAGSTGALVLATPFDGTIASTTVSSVSSTLSKTSSTKSTITSSSSSTKTSLSSSTTSSISSSSSKSSTTSKTSSTISKTSSSATPSKTLTPDNSCGNAAGGNNKGYTCNPQLAGGGACCSKNGYCGSSGAYCGAGCQSGFGTCGTLTQDNSCGNVGGGNNKGYMCNPNLANGGSCCSQNGYCGNSTSYCGTGCQQAFGTCN